MITYLTNMKKYPKSNYVIILRSRNSTKNIKTALARIAKL